MYDVFICYQICIGIAFAIASIIYFCCGYYFATKKNKKRWIWLTYAVLEAIINIWFILDGSDMSGKILKVSWFVFIAFYFVMRVLPIHDKKEGKPKKEELE